MEFSFFSLMIIAFLAFFVPMVLERRKIPLPLVVAEILVGIIFGKSGFNLIREDIWIEFMSTLGFAYLMFSSGLEIDFTSGSKKNLFLGSAVFILTLGVSYLLSLFMVSIGLVSDPVILVLILATTSLGVVTPVLKEKGLFEKDLGQAILTTALIADFVTVFLITIYFAVAVGHHENQWFWVLLLFVAFFIVLQLFKRLSQSKLISELRGGISQIEVRGSFFLILFFVALSEVLGSEIILGAFLAGVMVSLLLKKDAGEVYEKLDAIGYGFLIPIFFIMVGVRFDIRDILSVNALLLVPIILILMYLVKIIPSLIYTFFFGVKHAVASGVILSARLSLIIATSTIAAEEGLISHTTSSAILLVAILTCVISPAVFNKMIPTVKTQADHVLIIGANEYTLSLYRKLNDQYQVRYLVEDAKQAEKAKGLKLPLVDSNSLQTEFEQSTIVLAALKDEEKNLKYCLEAKKNGVARIGCLVNSEANANIARKHGIESISPQFSIRAILDAFIRVPHVVKLIDEELTEIMVTKSDYIGMPLKRLSIFGDGLILKIFRGQEELTAHGNTTLRPGDVLLFSGSKETARKLRDLLS